MAESSNISHKANLRRCERPALSDVPLLVASFAPTREGFNLAYNNSVTYSMPVIVMGR
ncbi:hypothetical protein RvY_03696 [Ramazzottius varieornatus]|uniref:Uncharacterized protein n=1 Tax=Ramazzottius varieornatus TaxID=947166 RepID=A0A1D1UP01_RAMVA|nr:hypothetical protein RvY_03696 [Ramazzottius varieornatus]